MRANPVDRLSDREIDDEIAHWLQRLIRLRNDMSTPFERKLNKLLSRGGLTLFLIGCPAIPIAPPIALVVWGVSGSMLAADIIVKRIRMSKDRDVRILARHFLERIRQLEFTKRKRNGAAD